MKTVKGLVTEWFASHKSSADHLSAVPKEHRQEAENLKANLFIYSEKGLTLRYSFKNMLMVDGVDEMDLLIASRAVKKIYRKAMHIWQEATNGTIQFKEVNIEEEPGVFLGVCGPKLKQMGGDALGTCHVVGTDFSARDGKKVQFGFPSFICLIEQNSIQMDLINEQRYRIMRGPLLLDEDAWVHIAAHELEHALLPSVPHLPPNYRYFSPSLLRSAPDFPRPWQGVLNANRKSDLPPVQIGEADLQMLRMWHNEPRLSLNVSSPWVDSRVVFPISYKKMLEERCLPLIQKPRTYVYYQADAKRSFTEEILFPRYQEASQQQIVFVKANKTTPVNLIIEIKQRCPDVVRMLEDRKTLVFCETKSILSNGDRTSLYLYLYDGFMPFFSTNFVDWLRQADECNISTLIGCDRIPSNRYQQPLSPFDEFMLACVYGLPQNTTVHRVEKSIEPVEIIEKLSPLSFSAAELLKDFISGSAVSLAGSAVQITTKKLIPKKWQWKSENINRTAGIAELFFLAIVAYYCTPGFSAPKWIKDVGMLMISFLLNELLKVSVEKRYLSVSSASIVSSGVTAGTIVCSMHKEGFFSAAATFGGAFCAKKGIEYFTEKTPCLRKQKLPSIKCD